MEAVQEKHSLSNLVQTILKIIERESVKLLVRCDEKDAEQSSASFSCHLIILKILF